MAALGIEDRKLPSILSGVEIAPTCSATNYVSHNDNESPPMSAFTMAISNRFEYLVACSL
jgi:hypothetical protein